jgi:hypothetical protein
MDKPSMQLPATEKYKPESNAVAFRESAKPDFYFINQRIWETSSY